MKFPKACIVVFAKEPIEGKVKTRLIPALGAKGAKEIHEQLMARIFSVINKLSLCTAQLWVDNNPESSDFNAFVGLHKTQMGADLGLRMQNAAAYVLQEFEQVVIIGSDCPEMNEGYLQQAFKALIEDKVDVVLGPAEDGGYVLIGMSSSRPEVFQNIEWGSEKVLQQTREQLQSHGLTWQELSPLYDIDRPEDLKLL